MGRKNLFSYEVVIIVPLDNAQDAEDTADSLAYYNAVRLTVQLSNNGETPVTHLGCRFKTSENYYNLIQQMAGQFGAEVYDVDHFQKLWSDFGYEVVT